MADLDGIALLCDAVTGEFAVADLMVVPKDGTAFTVILRWKPGSASTGPVAPRTAGRPRGRGSAMRTGKVTGAKPGKNVAGVNTNKYEECVPTNVPLIYRRRALTTKMHI